MKVLMIPAAALVLAALVPGQQGGDEPLTVSAIRFYQPANATTTIEGVCEVRLPALLRGVSQVSRYHVELVVLDSAGLELQRQDWMRDVPASLAHAHGATMIESFSFPAAPGHYRVKVRVTPSLGDAAERTMDVAAFSAAPPMSDLLLASSVRQPASDTEPLGDGEIRRAGLVMRTAPVPKLTPAAAMLSWYAEVYPRNGAGTGELRAEVVTAAGRAIVTAAPRPITIPAGGGVTRGSLDLGGLPEGEYRLRLSLRMGDSALVAEAPFAMGSVAALASAEASAASAASPIVAADLFEGASEARLDSLSGPLVYLVQDQRELALYRTLTADGKLRFLRQFWQRRDPTPSTPDNPVRDGFYRAVAYVNEAFHEGGRADVPGWNTDRGRIYLKYGRPDEMMPKPAASPRPYVAWKYTHERAHYYVFQDQTGLGNFALIGTDDRRETIREGWERVLGADNVRDAYAFLGLDIRNFDVNR